ncbi:MAG: hypothetical protein R2716_13610, partial [Microthrixaceae bacterium]
TPVGVVGLSAAESLAAGFGTSCATLGDGSVSCWGNIPAAIPLAGGDKTVPSAVSGVSGAEDAILTGGSAVINGPLCTLDASDVTRCTGSNSFYGLLGNGTVGGSGTNVQPTGLGPVDRLSGDASAICALTTDSKVRCWGYDQDNLLGDGGPMDQAAFGPVLGLP